MSDATSPAPASRTGETLGEKYRLQRRLGAGGMGAVYEAQHAVVGRRFAVKFLHPEYAGQKEMMARFQREAQTAGSLDNENIVGVVDFGFAPDGAPYIVMELLTGQDLRSLIVREGPLPAPRSAYVAVQACRGLAAAHLAGIIHRDLKPENLFIVRRGDGSDLCKILDFGIAKLRTSSGSGVSTRAGAVIGTLAYMPPEQVRGDKSIDHRADLYALGAVLYECLGGRPPHQAEEAHVLMYKILSEKPVPLATLRPNLPPGLVEVVHRALDPEPERRHSSAVELAEALAPFTGRQVTPITVVSERESDATVVAPVSMVREARPRTSETEIAIQAAGLAPRGPSRGRAIALASGLFAVALVAVLWARPWSGGEAALPSVPTASPPPTAIPSPAILRAETPPEVTVLPAAPMVTPGPALSTGRLAAQPERPRPLPGTVTTPPAPAPASSVPAKEARTETPAPAPPKPGRRVSFDRGNPYD